MPTSPVTDLSELLTHQQDRLLNHRLAGTIGQDTFDGKHTELNVNASRRSSFNSTCSTARTTKPPSWSQVFELSHTLKGQWLEADYAAKRRILEIVCLNCRLDGAKLVPTIRKPFDVLTEGLNLSKSRGDRTPVELFASQLGLGGFETQTLAPLRQLGHTTSS